MTKKYVLHPGYVRSRRDFDRHYIGAIRLARLYGVPLQQCLIVDDERPWLSAGLGLVLGPGAVERGDLSRLIHLYPDYWGEYRIPR